MSLVKCGGGITDIRGTFAGQHFKRDKSGLHCCRMQRRVHQRTPAQATQRNAFIKARTYTQDPRWVSYYIYLALNNIPYTFNTTVSGSPTPNCTGIYTLGGQFNGKDYYRRADSTWFIWWAGIFWVISAEVGVAGAAYWRGVPFADMYGLYYALGTATGNVTVTLPLAPPPADYEIPKL